MRIGTTPPPPGGEIKLFRVDESSGLHRFYRLLCVPVGEVTRLSDRKWQTPDGFEFPTAEQAQVHLSRTSKASQPRSGDPLGFGEYIIERPTAVTQDASGRVTIRTEAGEIVLHPRA